jgi:XTP/dITP diphosphohydrolase/tetrapyrrole methylase family protein/MazG family protein/ATP diphosphatase
VASSPVVAAPDALALDLAREHPDARCVPEPAVIAARRAATSLGELWHVTARLRRDCPWDREQTAETIVPHTIEEAYEVADKALSGPPGPGLVDELGDLLFQTYFLALLADEAGAGDLADVAEGIRVKLVRRHPHVFGDASLETAADVRGRWEEIKRVEEGREGIFHDVPGALPALLYARKMQRRAAAVGFDWARWEDAWPAISEELSELDHAFRRHGAGADQVPPSEVVGEAGDLLFAAVNVLRLAGVDPELALRRAADRFRDRVERAEDLATADGEEFRLLGLDAQDGYYRQAKLLQSSDTGRSA